jgi:hypothetical protein
MVNVPYLVKKLLFLILIAIIGNGVANNRSYEEIRGRIAWSAGGKLSNSVSVRLCQCSGSPLSAMSWALHLMSLADRWIKSGNRYGTTATNRHMGAVMTT